MDNLTNEQCQALIDSVTTWENVSLTRNISGMYKDIPRGGELKFKQSEVDFWKDTHPDMLLEFVMKYESGDYCGLHIDSNWWVVKKPYIAMTTWITPLNDGYDGGELYVNGEFVEQVVGVPVKFPRTTEHEITEVTNGTRYSLVSWQFGEA